MLKEWNANGEVIVRCYYKFCARNLFITSPALPCWYQKHRNVGVRKCFRMLKFCYLFSPDPKLYVPPPIIWDLLEEKEEEACL